MGKENGKEDDDESCASQHEGSCLSPVQELGQSQSQIRRSKSEQYRSVAKKDMRTSLRDMMKAHLKRKKPCQKEKAEAAQNNTNSPMFARGREGKAQ